MEYIDEDLASTWLSKATSWKLVPAKQLLFLSDIDNNPC